MPAPTWSPWFDLKETKKAPRAPGIYRLRRQGQEQLDYVGQTGEGTMTLRKRLAMLSGVFGAVMPYNDPHTAGPGFWALRHKLACDFEVSVAEFEGSTPDRKAQETVAISVHRQEHLCSPTINFGRMPVGYIKSSGQTAKLKAAGKVFRGGPSTSTSPAHAPGHAPLTGDLLEPLSGPTWGGHAWTPWRPLAEAASFRPDAVGLYRLRAVNAGELLYIGEGLVDARLAAHAKKVRQPETAQGRVFAEAGLLEASWVINKTWLHHHRLELENDLIAAHTLVVGHRPGGQFLG